jgi:hypothetical protein
VSVSALSRWKILVAALAAPGAHGGEYIATTASMLEPALGRPVRPMVQLEWRVF